MKTNPSWNWNPQSETCKICKRFEKCKREYLKPPLTLID
jgi:hypothetical protein